MRVWMFVYVCVRVWTAVSSAWRSLETQNAYHFFRDLCSIASLHGQTDDLPKESLSGASSSRGSAEQKHRIQHSRAPSPSHSTAETHFHELAESIQPFLAVVSSLSPILG